MKSTLFAEDIASSLTEMAQGQNTHTHAQILVRAVQLCENADEHHGKFHEKLRKHLRGTLALCVLLQQSPKNVIFTALAENVPRTLRA